MVVADSGLIHVTQFSPTEQEALRKRGLVENGKLENGDTHEGVDPEKLWPLRNAAAERHKANRKAVTTEERAQGIENRATFYERTADSLEADGDSAAAATYRAKATELREKAKQDQPAAGNGRPLPQDNADAAQAPTPTPAPTKPTAPPAPTANAAGATRTLAERAPDIRKAFNERPQDGLAMLTREELRAVAAEGGKKFAESATVDNMVKNMASDGQAATRTAFGAALNKMLSGELAPAPVKWFGKREKADAWLAKQGIGATHEVVVAGKSRFEIQPKAAAAERAPNTTDAVSPTQNAPAPSLAEKVDEAAHEAAHSPRNDLPDPTDAQKEAGNYKKGHVSVQGLDISIENPKGSTRSGVGPEGPWSHEMSDHYGYLRGTVGADKDHVDVYLGGSPESAKVFVVDQIDQKTGRFDEHKVMLGFDSQTAAVAAYKANFDAGWRVGPVSAMSMDEFKDWLKDGDTSKPMKPGRLIENPDAKASPTAAPTTKAADTDERFKDNKIFTADKVAAARERLKSKLSSFNAGIDPEVLLDGLTIAGAYIESGARSFGAYAKAMVADLGDGVRPFLRAFYESVRHYPGFDNAGMSTPAEAERLHAQMTAGTDGTRPLANSRTGGAQGGAARKADAPMIAR